MNLTRHARGDRDLVPFLCPDLAGSISGGEYRIDGGRFASPPG